MTLIIRLFNLLPKFSHWCRLPILYPPHILQELFWAIFCLGSFLVNVSTSAYWKTNYQVCTHWCALKGTHFFNPSLQNLSPYTNLLTSSSCQLSSGVRKQVWHLWQPVTDFIWMLSLLQFWRVRVQWCVP